MNYFLSSTFLKVAGLSIVIFIVLDLVCCLLARGVYFRQMSYLATIENSRIVFNLPVGLSVQAIIALDLRCLFPWDCWWKTPWPRPLGWAFAGFVMYCTYDLTNLSFIRGYPVAITVIDIA
ncbi:MAG: DUF2177 family protein [Desulfobacterales bacterium]